MSCLQLQSDAEDIDSVGHGNVLTEAMEQEKTRSERDQREDNDGRAARPAGLDAAPCSSCYWAGSRTCPRCSRFRTATSPLTAGAGLPALLDNPLFRCLQREHLLYSQPAADDTRWTLDACRAVFDGSTKPKQSRSATVQTRCETMRCRLHGSAPMRCRRRCPPSLFIADLVARLQHLRQLVALQPSAYAATSHLARRSDRT